MTTKTSQTPPVMRPSALACIECRSKHLKCDGKQPVCSRCAGSAITCNYLPSRRGCKGVPKKRRRLNSSTAQQNSPIAMESSDAHALSGLNWSSNHISLDPPGDAVIVDASSVPFEAPLGVGTPAFASPIQASAPVPAEVEACNASPPNLDEEHVVNLYYSNFHPAHPILLPRHLYGQQRYPSYLQLVIQFIGSHFSASLSGDSLRSQTATALKDQKQKNAFMVQARLLFAVALHARNEPTEGLAMLFDAMNLAIELGMNTKEFAVVHGRGSPSMEESLRRTWWELFVVEGMMSAIHRRPLLKSSSVAMDALLPCEDHTYADGACLSGSFSLTQFTERHFADEDVEFSSYCYRIEAVQILSRVLSISNAEVHPDEVQAIDNSLAAWTHYVPPAKRDLISNSGEVDEMLFQAHMCVSWATILLHMPRSDLLSILPATSEIFCAQGDKHMSPTDTKHAHASKATDASKELSNLAALRCPVQKHTPFFICGLVIASVVQLAACTLHACRCMSQHRDRITLVVGLLKSLSQNWACAGSVLVKIKKIAAQVLRSDYGAKTATSTQCDSCTDSGIGIGTGEVPWLDFFDDPAVVAFERFAPGLLFPDESAS